MAEFVADGTPIFHDYAVTDGVWSRESLGEATRTGFETSFMLVSYTYQRFAAEAVSAHGRVMTTTRVIHIQKAVLSYGCVLAGSKGRGSWVQFILQA